MKINHDAENIKGIFEGHTLDTDRVEKIYKDLMDDPRNLLGQKKSETIEYLMGISEDPEALVVISMVLIKGLVAMNMMSQLKDATEGMMSRMDLTDMPKDLAEKILAADDAPEELKDRIRRECKAISSNPETVEDTDDEFEKLRREYR